MAPARITADALFRRVDALPRGRRALVAVAGAPGSGKSTLAEALVARLNGATPGRAAVLAMDGFHYDDAVLEARGWRARKGAPHTFDVGGLTQMLARLRAADEAEVAVPVFDRALEIARAGAAVIPQSVEVVVVEGNYLLLRDPPWGRLAGAFDIRVMLAVAEPVLAERLRARWAGYGLDPAAIAAKLEENDLPNGRTVRARSAEPDVEVVEDAAW